MQEERIRLTSTDSANSVNKNTFVDVEMQHHTKVFPFPSISDTIDQRELFEQERSDSTKYRLILTINPYCTNVLFNAVSEIVQNEGTDKPSDLCIASKDGVIKAEDGSPKETLTIDGYVIKGKVSNVTSLDMIRNTEYSNGDNPFVYHCGYDIFNNHILRNKSFKVVNKYTDNKHREFFNTFKDIMRYSDGSTVPLRRRNDINDIIAEPNSERHLYLKDDLYSYFDCVNVSLGERNGWWGFNNRSSIASSEFVKGTKTWDDLQISKVINGSYYANGETQEHMSCEFIEMYPDSTLYSFNPKYNKFQNREEQNWDICIMYPYESDYDNKKVLVKCSLNETDGNNQPKYVNTLLLASYKQTKGTSGQDIVLFRSYVKHNLKVGDNIKLYYALKTDNGEGGFTEIKDKMFNIVNTGDLNSNNYDYYFYINDVNDLKNELGINVEDKDARIEDDKYIFRFVRVVNGIECEYYYRKFRKLPNLRFKKEELTDEIVNNKESFNSYIDNNCRKTASSEMRPFNKEQYQLAFSKTIYDDSNTQIVFTDTIDIDKFRDNLGRPITELFICFIKRNKGHDLWYKKIKTSQDLKNIEFSHCFGKVISGLDVHSEKYDDELIKQRRKEISDVTLLTNKSKTIDERTNGDYEISLDDDIVLESKDKDVLYGDVVELDRYNMRETVLADVYFRFNTEQREHTFTGEEINCGCFAYDEIVTDDYDYNTQKHSFLWATERMISAPVQEQGGNVADSDEQEIEIESTTYRPEGYYYKAFYPIKVREFGSLRQDSHKDIKISSCKPKQANGMFIEVVSSLRSGVSSGDIVYLCDETEEMMIPLTVNSVQSNVRFLLNPMLYGSENYKNVFEIVEGLLHSDEKTITQEDIDNGYTWQDEYGHFNIASDEKTDGNDNSIIVIHSDIGRKVVDYSKPKYILRLKNNDIPSYACKVAVNTYLWRDVLNVGNKDTVELEEYPFANGHFYINKIVNFFLKRQDPFNNNGLYAVNQNPNDIFGNVKDVSNYVYKDEEHRVC